MKDIFAVVITGCGRGIGKEIALEFAADNKYALFLISKTEAHLNQTKKECQELTDKPIYSLCLDLSVNGVFDELEYPTDFPTPWVIVNNAGKFDISNTSNIAPEQMKEMWHLNTLPAIQLNYWLMPFLKKQEGGLVVNICSLASLEGRGYAGHYASAKHALIGYTRSLRLDLMATGIGVTAVNLGQTMSASWDGIKVDANKLIDPKDVAKVVLSLSTLSPRTVVEEINIRPTAGDIAPN